MSSRRKPVAESFVENWPAIARGAGLVIGFVEMGAGVLGRPVSTEVLAFAGGLIVAPNIAGVQAKRNDRREP
jgi:hypothetical protein